jgi:hypothetical protein
MHDRCNRWVLRPIITQQNSISTHVTYVSHFDIKGTVPGSIVSIMGAGQPLLIGTIRDLLTKQSSSSSANSIAAMQQQQSRMSLWHRIANGNDKTAPDYISSNSSSSASSSNSCGDDSDGYADAHSSDTTVITADVGDSITSADHMNDSFDRSSRHTVIGSHTQQSRIVPAFDASSVQHKTAIQQQDSIAINKSRFTDMVAHASTARSSLLTIATAAAAIAVTVLVCLAYSTSSEAIIRITLLGVGIAAVAASVALVQYAAQCNSNNTKLGNRSSLCDGQHVFVLHVPAVPLHMLLQHYRAQQHDSSCDSSTAVQIGVSHIVTKALSLVIEQHSSSLQQSRAAHDSIALHVVADNQPAVSKTPIHDNHTIVTTQSDSSSSSSSTIQQIAVSDVYCMSIDAIAQALSTNNTNTKQFSADTAVHCSSATVNKPIAVVMTKSHSDDSYRDSTATSCDSDTSSSVASVKHASSSSNSSDVSMAFTLPIVPTAKVVISIGDVKMFSTSTSTVSSRSSSRSTSNASSFQNSAQLDQHNTAAVNSTAMLQLTVMIHSSIDIGTVDGFVRSFKRHLRNPKRLLIDNTTSGLQGDGSTTVATSNSVHRDEKSSVAHDSPTTAAATTTVCDGTIVSTATDTTTTTIATAAAPLR